MRLKNTGIYRVSSTLTKTSWLFSKVVSKVDASDASNLKRLRPAVGGRFHVSIGPFPKFASCDHRFFRKPQERWKDDSEDVCICFGVSIF